MNDREKNHLLENLFDDDDDELEHLRQTTLSRGLREMRRRRHRSLAARILVMAVPALLLTMLAIRPHLRAPVPPLTRMTPPQAAEVQSKVEYITAEQLFALFPNRPMALVGKPGHQELIFLDAPPENRRQ